MTCAQNVHKGLFGLLLDLHYDFDGSESTHSISEMELARPCSGSNFDLGSLGVVHCTSEWDVLRLGLRY